MPQSITTPGDLRLVQAFVNSIDLEGGEDRTGDRLSLHDWLVSHSLIGPEEMVSEEDRRLVLDVREAIRALALANHEGIPDRKAVERLNRVAEGLRLTVLFDGEGEARLVPILPGVNGALAKIIQPRHQHDLPLRRIAENEHFHIVRIV